MPSRLRSHAVGIAVGLLAGCAHGTLAKVPISELSLSLLATLLGVAGIAGFLSSIILPQDLQDELTVGHVAVGKGLKAGLIAVLVGGSLLCLLARAAALDAPSSIVESALKSRMWLSLFVCVAAVLPGVVCGCVGGGLGGRLAALLPSRVESSASQHTGLPSWLGWLSRSVIALLSLGLLSPLTFIGRPPKVDPPPPVVIRQPPPVPPPAPPPFHFVASPDLQTAKFGQINVDVIKTLQGVDTQSPVSITPDYSQMAYCDLSRQGPSVTVFDLDWFKPLASFSLPAKPKGNLAWEPGYHRLACTTGSDTDDRRVWILDEDSGRPIELPRPKNRDLPSGDFHWWSKTELAFFPTDEPPLVLDLDTLMLIPISKSLFFKDKDDEFKKRWLEGPREVLPSFTKWKPDVITVLSANEPPSRRDEGSAWKVQGSEQWAFTDVKSPAVHLLPQLPVKLGTTLLCAPDASKMIMLHDVTADVVYMKIAKSPQWLVHAELPFAREGLIDANAESDITDMKLCAFVYAPLVNPLTNKVVGADHSRLKAVLRLQRWKAHDAMFAIVQRREDLHSDDVIADLHTWEEGSIRPWRFLQKPDWWTSVGDTTDTALPELSDPNSVAALEMPGRDVALFKDDRWTIQNRPKIEPKKPAPAAAVELPRSAPPSPPVPPVDSADVLAVKAFIEEHHRKASDGNIEGMMMDYTDLVDFMNRGRILRDRIQQDEINQRELWPHSTESIKDAVKIEVTGTDAWRATYAITFRNENASGGWQTGIADLDLQIARFKNGFRITGHKAMVHDVVSGQGVSPTSSQKAAGPPPVKIRLPSPVWATTMNLRLGDQTFAVHEAVALIQSRLLIHRTYRLLVDSSTPKEVAAKHPDGVISMQTAEMEGLIQRAGPNTFTAAIGRQGWVQTPDARSGSWSTACEGHAARMVGTAITFQNDGEDLVSGTVRLKLVKKQRK